MSFYHPTSHNEFNSFEVKAQVELEVEVDTPRVDYDLPFIWHIKWMETEQWTAEGSTGS